jgi:hypothetical protein
MSENCDNETLDLIREDVTSAVTDVRDRIVLPHWDCIWPQREAGSSALIGERPQIRTHCSERTYKVVLSGSIDSCFNSSS